ncbi:MAG: methylmalonyl-CoA mutase family protein [Rhizomicrobium sp.]
MPAIQAPRHQIGFTGATWPRARRACRWLSTCPPRPVTTATIHRKGEVGKVGVPVSHIGDMRTLFEGIPLSHMNTSMTINAPAAWLLALYVAVADEQGSPRDSLAGTTQNDIVKEYLARGTYIFPPARRCASPPIPSPSRRRRCRMESDQFLLLSSAGSRRRRGGGGGLRARHRRLGARRCKDARRDPADEFSKTVGRMSFFVNSASNSSRRSASCARWRLCGTRSRWNAMA